MLVVAITILAGILTVIDMILPGKRLLPIAVLILALAIVLLSGKF